MSMPEAKMPESWGKGKPFGRSFWVFAVLAVLAGVLCYRLKGTDAFIGALSSDLDLFMIVLPRMAASIGASSPYRSISRWAER